VGLTELSRFSLPLAFDLWLTVSVDYNTMGNLGGRDPADMSDMGTALPGYTPEDLLKIIDVNHLQIAKDAGNAIRRGNTLPRPDIERAAQMMSASQVKELLGNPGPGVVAVDGHFDRSQMGKISPLSHVCAMLSQALRHQAPQYVATPMSPQSDKGPGRNIVLEYFCALHTADDDELQGPQGLVRCLTTQLILSLVANEWIGQADAVNLPHLRDGEEELLAQRNLDAVCRLFTALVNLVPRSVAVYCTVDGWSAYELDGLGRGDYDTVLSAFRDAIDSSNGDGGANFKLLLTSPTSCRWLGDFLLPGQVVSLRNRDGDVANWRTAGRGGLMNLARAATMSDVQRRFGGGFPPDNENTNLDALEEDYNRRSST
jgi:hypothetical protein